jgi:hypothetical protein
MNESKMQTARRRIHADKISQIEPSNVLCHAATETEHLNAALREYQQHVSLESKLIEMLARYQS